MKNSGSMVRVIVGSVIAVLLTAVLIGYLAKPDSKNNIVLHIGSDEVSKNIYKSIDYDLNSMNKIQVLGLSEAVSMEASGKNNTVTVELRGSGWKKEKEPEITLGDGVLKITGKKHIGFSFGSRDIVIIVPENFDRDDFIAEVKSVSGAVKVFGIACKELTIESTSGSVKASDCSAKTIDINSVSGSIGAAELKGLLNASSVSGSIYISGSFEGFDVESTSGSIKIKNSGVITSNSRAETTSGSVRVELAEENKFNFSYSTTTGSVKNDFSDSVSGKKGKISAENCSVNLDLKTVTGSIRIAKLEE